jgi:outer membrane protein
MKKILLSLFVSLLFLGANAQKIAIVDTDYILENMSEFTIAEEQLEEYTEQWQAEIKEAADKLAEARNKFNAEAPVLPDEDKKKREEELKKMETDMKDLQKKYFGVNGEFFMKRQQLIKPIQEKVYNAIEEIANEDNYAIVFDKAGCMTIAYAKAKYDISDDVLRSLGYEPGGFGSGTDD